MDQMTAVLADGWAAFLDIDWWMVLQIGTVYAAIYAALALSRGSRFGQALAGIGIYALATAVISYAFDFDVLNAILRYVLLYLLLSSVVIFQPEIRRALTAIGSMSVFGTPGAYGRDATKSAAERFADCCMELSRRRLGALFAFERGISLRSYEMSGVKIDAEPSPELLVSLFTPPLPLHDGGVVVRRGRLASAHCLFPLSLKPELASCGMRHRAAAGLSSGTDGLVVVVSEETGRISVAHNGHLFRYSGEAARGQLLRWVARGLPGAGSLNERLSEWISIRRARLAYFFSRRERAADAQEAGVRDPQAGEDGK